MTVPACSNFTEDSQIRSGVSMKILLLLRTLFCAQSGLGSQTYAHNVL